MRIILIGGGWSPEREISLKGCEIIKSNFEDMGYHVVLFDLIDGFDKLIKVAKESDFAFINLHGEPGEDGLVQAILERIGCPYQGSDPRGSFLALNKAVAKALFKEKGIPTPDWEFLSSVPENWNPRFKYPVFIKPNRGGSSIDIKEVSNHKDLFEGISNIISKGQEVIIEEKIEGIEVTCGILEEKPLPLILIKPKSKFFDYFSKYSKDGAEEICPAPISKELTEKVQDIAIKCHQLLGLMDYSRVDFIIKEDVPYVLEVNTLPGMTERSLFPLAAKKAGYSYKDLLKKLVELGLKKRLKDKDFRDV